MKMPRAIVYSGTAEEFENSTIFHKQHTVWQKKEKLRRWLSTKWLCQAEVCVHLYFKATAKC